MPERVRAIERDGEDVRAELSAISLLLFFVHPDSDSYPQARRLNDELGPAREHARQALRAAPRDVRSSPALRAARERCWQLLDEAAVVIDGEDWFLEPGMTTRKWAQRQVDRLRRASRSPQR